MRRIWQAVLWLSAMAVSTAVLAEDGIHPYLEYRKRVEAAQGVSPLELGLFGEQISLYNGATEFAVTDIDIPGNSTLPVQLGRRLSVELQPQNVYLSYDTRLLGVGNWDVEVPYMAGSYAAATGWADTRCSVGSVPLPHLLYFDRKELWQGISVHVPDRGTTKALGLHSDTPRPSSGTYKLTTSERDVFDCIPMKSGLAGEGFRMTTSEGIRYYFDVGTSRTAARLTKYVKTTDASEIRTPVHLDRNHYYLLASRIEDRFGNTVEFQYNAGGHPTRIWSNDGREVVLNYSNGRLSSATAHGRTWQYQYNAAGNLIEVVNPDSHRWNYSYLGDLKPGPPSDVVPPMPWCSGNPLKLDEGYTLVATHPSGAIGTFVINNRRHHRSGVHATECMIEGDINNPEFTLGVPHYFDVMSIDSKTISGPGLPAPMVWDYQYSGTFELLWGSPFEPAAYPCTTCTPEKFLTVNHPDGTKSRYTFGMRYQDNDGRLLKEETISAANVVTRSETSIYMTEAQAASQPFHGEYGTNLGGVADPASIRVRPITTRAIRQDGVDFTWQAISFDTMARPKRVARSSTVAGNPARTEETTYHDNTAIWVLGQVAQVRCVAPTASLPAGCGSAGTVMSGTTYHTSLALPLATSRFGKTVQTLGYDTTSTVASGQRGTVRTVADGNGNTTTLTNWKRGIPQAIKYPGTPEAPTGATQSALVNDNGWITRITDESGYHTNYQYDGMGRLSQISYPVGDSVEWNPTTFSFTKSASSAYGIPAGHWQHTVATGGGRKVSYLDALWRPLLVREYDAANVSGTQRFARQEFDHEGRVIFASYPSANGTPLTGTWTEYDALGRPTSVSQDSELGLLITTSAYLTGLQTRVTSPKGHQTTTRYLAWDQPNSDHPVAIDHANDAFTDIGRDVFGKPVSITRRNGSGAVSLTRHYVYDVHQQLCKSVEPETAATIMAYDGAGNLAWSKAGASQTGTGSCNTADIPVAERTVRHYDARNRIQALIFPDNLGNTSYFYTPDGLLDEVIADNGGIDLVNTAYTYNRRRLPTGEAVGVGSHQWGVGYGYDANGLLQAHVLPGGLVIDYASNALGQPTRAGTYATGATYFPNGALKQFTYGNGIVRTNTQNARGLPERSRDAYGSTAVHDDSLDYDHHGNVAAISDGLAGYRGDRTMAYDALDRLTQTVSPMFGTANYSYDVLDNLRAMQVTSGPEARNHTYGYDASHRLTSIINTSSGGTVASLAYDAQGNLASRNGQNYQFDHGNRLRNVPGVERYLYDGHGRRVQAVRNDASIYSVYGQDGVLRYQRDERTGKNTAYVYLGGHLIAQLEDPLPLTRPTLTVPGYSGTGNYTVTWTTAVSATRYQLQERQGTGTWGTIHDAAGTSRAVSGKAAGEWGYRVRACNAAGCGDWSAVATTTVQLAPGAAPSLTVPSIGLNGSYSVTWNNVASASRYQLQERQGSGSWSTIHDAAGTSRVLSGKAAGSWGYRVRACNDAGCGGWSPAGTVSVIYPPGKLPALTAPSSNTTGSYTVSWTTAAGATDYQLQERLGSASWSQIQNSSSTSRSITGKSAGAWGYRVRACNDAGCGGWSPVATVTVTLPPSAAPALTAPSSNSTGNYTVSWTTVAAATRYQLQERLGSGGWSQIQNSGSTSQSITGKSAGAWGYRVRACNDAGCAGWSTTRTVTVTLPPTATPVLNAPTSANMGFPFLVTWTTVAGATRYELYERFNGGAWGLHYSGADQSRQVPAGMVGNFSFRVRGCNAGGCGPYSSVRTVEVKEECPVFNCIDPNSQNEPRRSESESLGGNS